MLYGNSLLYSVLAFVWYILYVIGLWKMFEKAGEAGSNIKSAGRQIYSGLLRV